MHTMRCACLRELCRTLLLGVPRLFPRPTATHRREGVNQPSFKRLAEDAGPEFADRGAAIRRPATRTARCHWRGISIAIHAARPARDFQRLVVEDALEYRLWSSFAD